MQLKLVDASGTSEQVEEVKPGAVTFDMFYAAYPRKVARKFARTAWSRINPADHQAIMDALPKFKKSEQWLQDGGMYIPYPATWLNQERWTDEFEIDLNLGQCSYNMHGNRSDEPRCKERATVEKRGLGYCGKHGERA